ncbi:BppU family phage baseplate upper protein [Clostridium tetani]|uniref:BppU family phage baseplate upper protein n=1 Tax=Clostridium tetani TaxID=1513 RepID=UPI00100B083D|nr:BppU family phage baseplate upper protein [Clostridium tetani]RXI55290.1 hypothetical protein DP122_05140 [Clostridium tetani]BDR64415.1 hypothetical protein K134307016_13490 [Clostridium tetani]
MEKKFDLLIDTKRTGFNTVRGLKEGDNNSVLNITLVQNSLPFDLTDLTVRINYKTPNNKLFLQMADITNATEGEININILTKVLNLAGEVKADLSIFDKDNRKITSVTFSMFVDTSVYSNDYIEQEDLDLIQQIYSKEKERQGNEDKRIKEETRRAMNEASRIQSEKIRKSNETERQDKEAERQKNELERIDNESKRVTEEETRVKNETTREESEGTRLANEDKREINENIRIKNEAEREKTHEEVKEVVTNIGKIEPYNNDKTYKKLNRVTHNGSSYEALKDVPEDVMPTNEEYWICIAEKGKDGTGAGDMLKEVYDKNNNGIVDLAEKALSVEWVDVKNVPLNEIGKVKSVNGKDGEVVLNASDIKTSREKSVEQELSDTKNDIDKILNKSTEDITYYVDEINGSDDNDGLSKDTAFKTLRKAIESIPSISGSQYIIDIISDIHLNEGLYINNKFLVQISLLILSSNNSTIYGEDAIYGRTLTFSGIPDIRIESIKFDKCILYISKVRYGKIYSCNFIGVRNNSAIKCSDGSFIRIANCDFKNIGSTCIYTIENAHVHSFNNSGQGSIGLNARQGGVISKEGTQPTGTTYNEFTISGGVIR